MELDPKKHYSMGELVRLKLFPIANHTMTDYIRFIGHQTTMNNPLIRDTKAEKNRGWQPFKGSDVIKFLNNIK